MPENDPIQRIEPEGLQMFPMRPVKLPHVDSTKVEEIENRIDDHVLWPSIIMLFIKEKLITDILTFKKGGSTMNNDTKTTIAGAIAAIAQVLSLFGIGIPDAVLQIVTAVAVAIGFYFTNKANAKNAA